MKNAGYSKVSSMLLTCLIVLCVAGFFLFFSNKTTSVTNKKNTSSEQIQREKVRETVNDSATEGWNIFRDENSGISFKYPSYITVSSDLKSSKVTAGPTARSFYSLNFTPNPNSDFETFSAFVEVNGAKNFVLNIGSRFVSYDPNNETWYVNTDSKDKPTPTSPTYKNIYKDGNQFSPNIFSKTVDGSLVYGVFRLGDESRGTDSYLVMVPERDIIVHVGLQYNMTAIEGSTMAIQTVKKNFDKDLPHILRSITAL